MTFDELLADVGEKLTQIQRWQREFSELGEAAASESGAVAVEGDALGKPSRLWLAASALRLQPHELGRQIVATYAEAAAAVDYRRGEIDRDFDAETSSWAVRNAVRGAAG